MPLVDALKAVASQLIVLHHLSASGPPSAAPYTKSKSYETIPTLPVAVKPM